MNHRANHAEGPQPQAHEHTTRIPREQVGPIHDRWGVRTAAAQIGAQVFWTMYAQYAPASVPQSSEVAAYEQAQQEAAQRNIGANVVQAAATQHYETQPASYAAAPQSPEVKRYQAQQETAQPAIAATPAVEVNLTDGTDETVEPLAEEISDPYAPATIAADAGIDIEALRRQIERLA